MSRTRRSKKARRARIPPELPEQDRRTGRPGALIDGKKGRRPRRSKGYYRDLVRVVTSEYTVLSFLGVLIGVLAAVGAWFFREMILFFRGIFLGTSDYIFVDSIIDYPYGALTFAAPVIGGLIVGLLIYRLAPEAKGHGVPEVMEAVAIRGGKIRSRVIAVKALASSISIGSGGSVGREGPIVQIGSAVGSLLGQKLNMPEGWTKIMVACGATGAVTATFNTPIAGVIFSLELILMELKTRSFIPMVVTSVFAKVVSIQLLGNNPAFDLTRPLIDTYVLISPWELLIYLLLGLFAGLVAVLFVKTVYSLETLFDMLKARPYLKPMLGGLIIAVIALVFPQVLGVGYETIDAVLKGKEALVPLYLLIALIFIKIIGTSVTIGSGGSGGVFSPSLFIGAMLGGAVGMIANTMFPGQIGPAGAYAVVGMAALFAGVGRATFTSIIIVFEMTLDYHLILPVMFACVVSDAVSSVLMKETIYTMKLAKRGVRIIHDMEVNLLEVLVVRDAMVEGSCVECVPEDVSIGEVYSKVLKTEHMGFPVMDKNQRLVGIITFHDVDRAMSNGYVAEPARWFCTRRPSVTYADETLEEALQKMQRIDISHLPVVSRTDKKELKGFITKGDILRAYAKKHLHERKRRSYASVLSKKHKKRKGHKKWSP